MKTNEEIINEAKEAYQLLTKRETEEREKAILESIGHKFPDAVYLGNEKFQLAGYEFDVFTFGGRTYFLTHLDSHGIPNYVDDIYDMAAFGQWVEQQQKKEEYNKLSFFEKVKRFFR